jgi:hypothetical protein
MTKVADTERFNQTLTVSHINPSADETKGLLKQLDGMGKYVKVIKNDKGLTFAKAGFLQTIAQLIWGFFGKIFSKELFSREACKGVLEGRVKTYNDSHPNLQGNINKVSDVANPIKSNPSKNEGAKVQTTSIAPVQTTQVKPQSINLEDFTAIPLIHKRVEHHKKNPGDLPSSAEVADGLEKIVSLYLASFAKDANALQADKSYDPMQGKDQFNQTMAEILHAMKDNLDDIELPPQAKEAEITKTINKISANLCRDEMKSIEKGFFRDYVKFLVKMVEIKDKPLPEQTEAMQKFVDDLQNKVLRYSTSFLDWKQTDEGNKSSSSEAKDPNFQNVIDTSIKSCKMKANKEPIGVLAASTLKDVIACTEPLEGMRDKINIAFSTISEKIKNLDRSVILNDPFYQNYAQELSKDNAKAIEGKRNSENNKIYNNFFEVSKLAGDLNVHLQLREHATKVLGPDIEVLPDDKVDVESKVEQIYEKILERYRIMICFSLINDQISKVK